MGISIDNVWAKAQRLSPSERLALSRRLAESVTETETARRERVAKETLLPASSCCAAMSICHKFSYNFERSDQIKENIITDGSSIASQFMLKSRTGLFHSVIQSISPSKTVDCNSRAML